MTKRTSQGNDGDQQQKEAVIGTNNSSIVSKRSVERIFYNEPHFFRPFVKKPQRRSPLINKGYWLRMRAVDTVVQQLLENQSEKRKVIVNLGCGYDPLAFQWLSKPACSASDVVFVDVDFPELLKRKADTVASSPSIVEVLGKRTDSDISESNVYRWSRYMMVGCDLTDPYVLENVLSRLVNLSKCLVLFTAEVSMTYMPETAATGVIAWAARYSDVRFCLLEQYLPDGQNHPFARQMIQHFNKLQTPLKNIGSFPKLSDLEDRFHKAGWPRVSARSLWDVYCDNHLVPEEERLRLNVLEDFDEWEEFVLFASHYFLLTASSSSEPFDEHHVATKQSSKGAKSSANMSSQNVLEISLAVDSSDQCFPGRKFGAASLDYGRISHFGGFGLQARMNSTDFYGLCPQSGLSLPDTDGSEMIASVRDLRHAAPEPRMCHTMSAISQGSLLVGGRKSPGQALSDCWKLSKTGWRRSHDLPHPVYRHCTCAVSLQMGGEIEDVVLVYGGKMSAQRLLRGFLLWREKTGWLKLSVRKSSTERLSARFGASLVSDKPGGGILSGGMALDGTLVNDHWHWDLAYVDGELQIALKPLILTADAELVRSSAERFGAHLVQSSLGLLIIGGVAQSVIPQDMEILRLSARRSDAQAAHYHVGAVAVDYGAPRPLLVGHNVIALGTSVVVLGGGAVCFSFGSFWNTSPLQISLKSNKESRLLTPLRGQNPATKASIISFSPAASMRNVPRCGLNPESDFDFVLKTGQPVILENLDLGRCLTDWQSLDYLKEKVGANREVSVHDSASASMSFTPKNFKYSKKSFGDFLGDIEHGSYQYLRALADGDPAGRPANLDNDFPQLAQDFRIPDKIRLVEQQLHSKVLRISGPVNMWLHYDVMANVLCQIKGSKTLRLFPPSDVSYLSIPAGGSSSAIDCFRTNFSADPQLSQTHPYEANLAPGDVLYIPPLWPHTASPTASASVAVNVFFRNLDAAGYAAGRDVYGNRDLQAYEKGRRDIDKICISFARMPADVRGFYLDRLGTELKERAWNVMPPS